MARFLQALLAALLRWLGRNPPRALPAHRAPKPAPRPARGAPAADFAGVRVEYAPSIDGEPDPGEIVWTWVRYEDDPSRGKDRPVLLIGRRDGHLVGVALTSKRDERSARLDVGAGPWDREGRTSYAKLDRLIDVDARAVRREGAVIERRRFDSVIAALRQVHS